MGRQAAAERLASYTFSAMSTRTISLRVSDEAARAYETASEPERRRIEALVTIQLAGSRRPSRSLEEVMGEISRRAQERGLTPEILGEILDGRG